MRNKSGTMVLRQTSYIVNNLLVYTLKCNDQDLMPTFNKTVFNCVRETCWGGGGGGAKSSLSWHSDENLQD